MIDMTVTTIPKSDQINADDMIGGPRTIRINKVTLTGGEQPCAINFDGEAKVWRPGKSMRRVLVKVWGKDANAYVGRSLTIYCDPNVSFGGVQVGGIRISHMTDIDCDQVVVLTASQKVRKPFVVHPLVVVDDTEELEAEAYHAASQGSASYQAFWKGLSKGARTALLPKHDDYKRTALEADAPDDDDMTMEGGE